jgi:hypothetical protein
MTTATKQTAANNKFLAAVKKQMNAPIFKRVSEILNGQGEKAATEYLGSFFRPECRDAALASFNA